MSLSIPLMVDEKMRGEILKMVREQVRPVVEKLMEQTGVVETVAKTMVKWLTDVPQPDWYKTNPQSKLSILVDHLKGIVTLEMRSDILEMAKGLIETRLNDMFERRFNDVTAFRAMVKTTVREVLREELANLGNKV